MSRWEGREGWCHGSKDPSAPHDLRTEGATTPDGKCKQCKRFSNRKTSKKQRFTDVAPDAVESVVRAVEEGGQGVPAFPSRSRPGRLSEAMAATVPRTEPVNPFAVLFDPEAWPDPESDEPPPFSTEDWEGDTPEEKRACLRAMHLLTMDRTQSMYTRRLAFATFKENHIR